MLTNRRNILRGLAALAVGGMAGQGRAQTYPEKPLRLVIPFAPGGGPDVLTRQFLPKLSVALGQAVFIDNKVGAGGILAAEFVAQQAPDGYTMLLGASTHVTQKILQPKVRFDPIKGFTHVTRLSFAPSLLVVSGSSPYRTVDDVVRAARAAPGKLNYGSGGVGSAAHLAGAAFSLQSGIEVVHIPYRGSVDIAGALAAGDIQFSIPTASTVVPLLKGDRLRALAITSAQRMASLPELPTLKEITGSDDLVLVAWSGLWLPAGASPAVVNKLFEAHRQVYSDPEIVRALEAAGVTVALSASPAEFAAFVAAETAKYQRIVKVTNITVD